SLFCPSRSPHTRFSRDWSSDVSSSDLGRGRQPGHGAPALHGGAEIPENRPPVAALARTRRGAGGRHAGARQPARTRQAEPPRRTDRKSVVQGTGTQRGGDGRSGDNETQ